jgi:uncharacterized OB-fold protein
MRPDIAVPSSVELPTPPQVIDPETAPYWEAAAEGRLLLPFCRPCAGVFWYPRGFCPFCGSTDVDWTESSGMGTVYSYTAVRRSSGDWAKHTPYYLTFVELDDGVTVAANLVGIDEHPAYIGMRVRAVFECREPSDSPILRFRPLK